MKKIITLLLAVIALSVAVTAQPGQTRKHKHSKIKVATAQLSIVAKSNEEFVVYIDGEMINNRPQRRVDIEDLTREPHELSIVLKKPAEKILNFQLQKKDFGQCELVYSRRDGTLQLLTPAFPQPPQPTPAPRVKAAAMPPAPPANGFAVEHYATERDMQGIISELGSYSFETDRQKAVHDILRDNYFTTKQIVEISKFFSFDSNRLQLFKEAYKSCIDQQNYLETVKHLTFESNRTEMISFIRTQSQR